MRRDKILSGLSVHSLVWLAILSGLALSGCQATPHKKQSASGLQASKTPAVEPANGVSPASSVDGLDSDNQHALEPKLSPAEKARISLEERLLAEAEVAFRAGRLTEPAHNNAYDRFQSVLMLNPGNSLARSGVQAILLSYADRIRNALKGGQAGAAASLLRQAEIYYPANTLLMDLKKEVGEVRAREEELILANEPENSSRVDYPLPEGALSRKSSTITDYLKRIAQRVSESDELVLIYARTDSEGRWIYSQLKKAVPGYRVRGDIKIASSPKITILPPLQ